ncbi:MAG: serine hydrolase [Planctomycetes bacterium]|nr:serine hydrolase [Planctomycetota bacterium]
MMTKTNRHEISRRRGRGLAVFLLMVTALAIAPRGAVAQTVDDLTSKNWHQWRGPEANGVSRTATPPIEWDEEKNIRWKVAINGNGSSTPIIWGDRVFLLTAIDTGIVDPSLPKPEDQPDRVFGIKYPNTTYRFVVLCIDRETGKELWRRTATENIPHEGHHGDNDFASASPTTDGKRLYCWFGSAGLFCYDLDGKRLWERDLGKAYMGASLGEGCSPVVHDGRLVIVRDQQRQSNIEVLDAKSGKTLWRSDRDEPNAWATPRVVEYGDRTQVITAASNLVRSYDLHTGKIIWQCSGLTGNVIPCPVTEGDTVYCMSGYEGQALLALPLSVTGDISNSDQILWTKRRATPYVPSPLLYDGMLYFNQSNQAILSCLDSKTGNTIIERTRLPGISNIYASPVGAEDRIYFTGRDGTILVLQRSSELKVLATNHLDDEFDASPALAGNQLFLRGKRFLYCISQDSKRRIASDSLARARAQLRAAAEAGEIAGGAHLVVRDGETCHLEVPGVCDIEDQRPFEADTLLRIYSMTKPITSVAAMTLFEQGKFELDDPVSKFIPAFAETTVLEGDGDSQKTVPAKRPITIRDVFRHTTGYSYGDGKPGLRKYYEREGMLYRPPAGMLPPKMNIEQAAEALARIPALHHPGERFTYGFNTDLLGRLIEVWSGKPLDQYLHGAVLEPLEMVDTGFSIPKDKRARLASCHTLQDGKLAIVDKAASSPFNDGFEFLSGGGGLISTVPDYANFCQMMVDGGSFKGKQLLKPDTIRLMFTDQLNGVAGGFRFGLGFAIAEVEIGSGESARKRSQYSWGGYASTDFRLVPEERLFQIVVRQRVPSSHELANRLFPIIYRGMRRE